MAIKTGQRRTISPVAAVGSEVTVVHTAAVTVVVGSKIAGVIRSVIDVVERIAAGSMTINTNGNDCAVHMRVMTGTAGTRFIYRVRVVVTGSAIIGDVDSPEVVCGTAIVRIVIGNITKVVTVVGTAGIEHRAIVRKGNTAAASRTDLPKIVDVKIGRHFVEVPVRLRIVAGGAFDRGPEGGSIHMLDVRLANGS